LDQLKDKTDHGLARIKRKEKERQTQGVSSNKLDWLIPSLLWLIRANPWSVFRRRCRRARI
jgi:hypothetical protein